MPFERSYKNIKKAFVKPSFIRLVLQMLLLCSSFSISAKDNDKKTIDQSYTINFENVSLLEYVRFVGKICDVNFIYNEEDLPFNVSVISEEPISQDDIMSTLVQLLRTHGLSLIEQDNNLLIHKTAGVTQLATIVEEGKEIPPSTAIVTRVFRIANAQIDTLATALRPLMSTQAVMETLPETKQIIITDVSGNIEKLSELIHIIDSAKNPLDIESYTINQLHFDELLKLTQEIMTPLIEKNPFLLVPQETTDSVFVISTPNLVKQAIEVMKNLDVPSKKSHKNLSAENIFIYKAINHPVSFIMESLKQLAKNLQDHGYNETGFIESIDNMKEVKGTSSILFVGSPPSIAKVKELLSTIDIPSSEATTNKFFVYPIKNVSEKQIMQALEEMAENLKKTDIPDKSLIQCLDHAKYISQTHSILFTGPPGVLKEAEQLLANFDSEHTAQGAFSSASNQFLSYKPQHQNGEYIEESLKHIANNLHESGLADPTFLKTIESMKWVKTNNTLLFTGNSASLKKVEDLLKTIDAVKGDGKGEGYFLYKLQYVPGNIIEEDLEKFANKLKSQGISNPQLLEVIKNVKWIKETNSLLLSGHPASVDEAKKIIAEYDVPRSDASPLHGNFFMYQPQHTTANHIQESLKELASNLASSDLSNPNLLNAIKSMKYVKASHSIVFTGDKDSLDKVKEIIKTIDYQGADSQAKLGKSTILVYKIQHAPIQQFSNSLKSIANDLEKTHGADHSFIATLNSMKYDQTTHSLIFTGPAPTLEKVKGLLEKFDIPSVSTKGQAPSEFFVYKPQFITGPSLEKILHDFADHLKISGFANQNLFHTIESMKWVKNTNSLIFSGDAKSIEEIKKLLLTFDVPGKGDLQKGSIQPIDQTSFLVYKLQYHKGDEIQTALRQIAQDLMKTHATIQQSLLNAINSIQWIQVTNSLLCTGDQETMTRLKELIKNLDVPLKQVFIEMLVIETNLNNLLSFGLNWGGKYKFRDRFTTSSGNFPPDASSNPAGGTFGNNLNQISSTRTPIGTDIPFEKSFDLGIIGDIIMHKGKSFFSLGSLVQALQSDSETTVVMTPKIITQDNKASAIFIGRNIPYVGSQTTNQGNNTATTTNLEYRDIGMNLNLTPVLGNSDTVTLAINLDKSSVLADSSGNPVVTPTSGTVSGITTSKTTMSTTVHIPNKSFLVLSGMITDQKTRDKAGIPCLGGLPLIGAAFSKADINHQKDNLVIFIRPHIVNSYKDMAHLTASQEDFFRENAGSATLERDYEESAEMLKSIDIEHEEDDDDE